MTDKAEPGPLLAAFPVPSLMTDVQLTSKVVNCHGALLVHGCLALLLPPTHTHSRAADAGGGVCVCKLVLLECHKVNITVPSFTDEKTGSEREVKSCA